MVFVSQVGQGTGWSLSSLSTLTSRRILCPSVHCAHADFKFDELFILSFIGKWGRGFRSGTVLVALLDDDSSIECTAGEIVTMNPEIDHAQVSPHPSGSALAIVGVQLKEGDPILRCSNEVGGG